MKGKQLAMDGALEDLDRYEREREKLETDAIRARLDEKYLRLDRKACDRGEIPAGTVVIIGQDLFRNGHYTLHFYRAVLDYHRSLHNPTTPHFVEQQTEEWPDVPPWADTVGHEGEARDIMLHNDLIYWDTREIVEPIKTWWMKFM
jgi:hypothetical protein